MIVGRCGVSRRVSNELVRIFRRRENRLLFTRFTSNPYPKTTLVLDAALVAGVKQLIVTETSLVSPEDL